MKQTTFVLVFKFKKILIPLFVWSQCLSTFTMANEDEIRFKIKKTALQETIQSSLTELLGSDQSVDLSLKNIDFSAKKVRMLKGQVDQTSFLVVYGEHLLNVEFDQPFRIDISLKNVKSNVVVDDLKINLKKSIQVGDTVEIPFDFKLVVDSKVNIGKTNVTASVLDKNLNEQNVVYDAYIEKIASGLRSPQDNGGNNIKPSFDSDHERVIFASTLALRACHQEYNKSINSKNNSGKINYDPIAVNSGSHQVAIKDLTIKVKGSVVISNMGEKQPVISFKISPEDLKDVDNITSENFNNVVQTNLVAKNFDVNPVITASFNRMTNSVDCQPITGSANQNKENLIQKLAIPAVKKILKDKIPSLLVDKVYSKFDLSKIKIPFAAIRALNFNKDQLFKSQDNQSQNRSDIINLLSNSFGNISAAIQLNSISIDQDDNLQVGFVKDIDIDGINLSKKHNNIYFKNKLQKNQLTPMSSDLEFNFTTDFVADLVHEFDYKIINYYSSQIPLLQDENGSPVLTMNGDSGANHGLILNPYADNTIDISLILNADIDRMKGFMGFILGLDISSYLESWGKKIESGLDYFFCDLILNPKNSSIFSSYRNYFGCNDESVNQDSIKKSRIIELGLDFKITHNPELNQVKASLLHFKNILFSQEMNNLHRNESNESREDRIEANKNQYILKMIRYLLSVEYVRNKALVEINKILVTKKLPKLIYDASQDSLSFDLKLQGLEGKAVKGIAINSFQLKKGGYINLKANILDASLLKPLKEIKPINIQIKSKAKS